MNKETIVKICSWALAALVLLLAVIVWANERLNGRELTLYAWFPLLGLGAFSLMWTHYMAGVIRRVLGVEGRANKTFYKATSIVVLALILLHPGLLIFQLYQDGFGLPPQSYLQVYGEPAMKGAIMLGTISLLIFLAFELHRKFRKKSWWKYIDYAQIVPMFLIFYHGLTLGRELSEGWYRFVWYGYGVSLFFAVLYNSWYDRRAKLRRG